MDIDDFETMGGQKYDLRMQKHRSSLMFMEDMDTSESDHSDQESAADDWIASGRKRKSKFSRRSRSQSSDSADVVTVAPINKAPEVCCLCSRNSFYKTTKCECQALLGICGPSCGCQPARCTNRGAVLKIKHDVNDSKVAENTNNIASHGAMLLQSALLEKSSETKDNARENQAKEDDGQKRKPLTNIGNTLAKSKSHKANHIKKWKKSVIQLVPVPPQENTEVQNKPESNSEAVKKPESSSSNAPSDSELPLLLPRAMQSAASNSSNSVTSNPSRERNSDTRDESVGANKEAGLRAARSPVWPATTSDEKENHRL